MGKYLKGATAGVLLVGLLGFAFQQRANSPSDDQRYVIYGADQTLPMLLDVRTGRTWFRQIVRQEDGGGMVWTPVSINPPHPGLNYSPPQ